MIENDIIKILKGLNSINPGKEYSENSRMVILASPQKEAEKTRWFSLKHAIEIFRLSTAVGVISFLLLVLMGGVSYINNTFSPLALDGLNQNSLTTEAAGIDNSIQITLSEIKYLDQSNKKAIKTIDQVSQNKPVYKEATSTITTSTIETAEPALENSASSTATSSIDELLNQISQ